jgi:predicted phage terminase large subunit-like protein
VRADYSAIVTVAIGPEDETYVLEAKRGRWNPLELINEIFSTHIRFKPSRIAIETFGFQQTLKFFLTEEMRRRSHYLPMFETPHESGRSKEARIMSLQPRIQYCKFYVKRDMVDLVDELMRFPKGKHDDVIDALAYTENLRRTPAVRQVPQQLQGETYQDILKRIKEKRAMQSKIGAQRVLSGQGLSGQKVKQFRMV